MILCPYCGEPASLVLGSEVPGTKPSLHVLKFWMCRPCRAWVICKKGTEEPHGVMANGELREAQRITKTDMTHLSDAYRTVHRCPPEEAREAVRRRLARALHLPLSDCNVRYFDMEECMRAIVACNNLDMSQKERVA